MYRDHVELCNPGTLQLIAYFDEIEICNPLGSSAKKHKVGLFLTWLEIYAQNFVLP